MNCIATIVSANYLAYARTLEASVRQHQPDADFRVLIVDRPTEEVKAAVARSGLRAVYAQDLGIPDFEHVAFKYELVELNTALKPTFLKSLFAEGFSKVAYLDPDIRVFSSLAPVFDPLDNANIVLTPHAMAPAMDGLRPSDIDFLRNGTFNLGFVALSNTSESIKILNWWEERCLTYGFNDLGFGTFVDQKWMDLVPCYFAGAYVLKHPGCNVAYWNLHEREVTGSRGNFQVDDYPLCFFHFSGVKAERPTVLSRHQTRHSIQPGTTLAELVADYCEALLSNEHKAFAGIKYTFSNFDNGDPITVTARRAACFTEGAASRPFAAGTPLHTLVKQKGMLKRSGDAEAGANTLSFDQDSRRVRTINGLVRVAASVLGIERFSTLARYMGYLTRESNMARVLLDRPFELAHKRNNSRFF